jgi:hypothetical protein
MRDNPQRLAWTVLLAAFASFCALVIGIPLGIRWYRLNAMNAEKTSVTSVHGTVLAQPRNASIAIPITDGSTTDVEEATRITTDNTSQAILTFFNDSTLTLYGNTSVAIQYARSPRFSDSQQPDTIIVELESGRVRAAPSDRSNPTGTQGLRFEIHSPEAIATLGEGSYSVEVNSQETQVTTRLGLAQLVAKGHSVVLKTGERAIVEAGQPPSDPLPAEKNLLVNGDFSQPLEGSWEMYRVVPPGGVVTTTLKSETSDLQTALQFQSTGQDNLHSEIGIIQPINRSVQDFDSLRIQLDVRIEQQSLPGGGTMGSEFPLMIHLAYKDTDGGDRGWYYGFYYVPASENWILFDTPDNSSRRIVRQLWYPFESPNLLESLGAAKPVYLKYIRLYASGWLYDTYVANVTLLAQE